MPFALDWKLRVEYYIEGLKKRINKEIVPLKLEIATTYDLLELEEAKKLNFTLIENGTPWGEKWEYAWFRSSVNIPPIYKGKRIEVYFKCNETLVWVNGKLAGSTNRKHDYVLLTTCAEGGKRYELMFESYAGHGATPEHYCIVVPDEDPIPEPVKPQRTVPEASIITWNEQAYQLYMDIKMLYLASNAMDENSMRRNQMEKALEDVTCILKLEESEDIFNSSVEESIAFLKPYLEAHNGSTTPEMFCIGHGHLDIAWLWDIEVTKRKVLRTFSTALSMMKEYPEYKFLQSQPYLYTMVKEMYPELYIEIKKAIERGQWIADGAMWVESDTNLVSGESLIRQFMYGKRFFKEEFGLESKVLWLPDVFGYSGALPQIMKGCGVEYFSTHKIYKNFQGGTDFPYDTYQWEGIDGSKVIGHNHRIYNARTKPDWLLDRWNKCNQKKETKVMLYPYGWGDGGGGPARDHLEYLRRTKDFEGVPKTRQASLLEFFQELERVGLPDAKYVGELYYEAHRGVYTTQANVKKGNRKSELGLREIEMWHTVASAVNQGDYPKDEIETLWKKVLLNQFHDILPGSSIEKVYEVANREYMEILRDINILFHNGIDKVMTESDNTYTVFNSLSWVRDTYVVLPISNSRVSIEDEQGKMLSSQSIKYGDHIALLVQVPSIPPCGTKILRLVSDKATNMKQGVWIKGNILENDFLRVEINNYGEIVSLWDKEAIRELIPTDQKMNKLEMYQDQPTIFDAWEIEAAYKKNPVDLYEDVKIVPKHSGPLEVSISIKRTINNSVINQNIILRAGERKIDFECEVDWRETHKLLKVAFPADIQTDVARYEIQFGHIKRATHQNTAFEKARFEVSGHKWMDISEHNYGMTIINDCKYGWDVLDGIPRLTLLRSPIAPDKNADRGIHNFIYSVYVHNTPFDHNVVRQGYELNIPAKIKDGTIIDKMSKTLLSVDTPNIIVETIKKSEDGESIIVRMYEALKQTTRCKLKISLPIESISVCNMIEEQIEEIPLSKESIELRFRPFEVKTLQINLK